MKCRLRRFQFQGTRRQSMVFSVRWLFFFFLSRALLMVSSHRLLVRSAAAKPCEEVFSHQLRTILDELLKTQDKSSFQGQKKVRF